MAPVKSKRRRDTLDQAMEHALKLGDFIDYSAAWSFITELESLSHYRTEPAAKKLARLHPDIAAKLYRALGIRILNSRKSKYYEAALSHFEQARRYY